MNIGLLDLFYPPKPLKNIQPSVVHRCFEKVGVVPDKPEEVNKFNRSKYYQREAATARMRAFRERLKQQHKN